MGRHLLVLVAFAAVALPGIGHGLFTGRWAQSQELERLAARLSHVPMKVGDWQGEDSPLDARQVARAEMTGYVSRRYTHTVSRHTVVVLLACGRPGPVSVHTPDVCYENSGYELMSDSKRTFPTGSETSAEFKSCIFTKAGAAAPTSLQIHWSWSDGGTWQVPSHPRLTFGGQPGLYKLYVLCSFAHDRQRKEVDEACTNFMQAFLPQLERALFERTFQAMN